MKKTILLVFALGLSVLFAGRAYAGKWEKAGFGWSYINDDQSKVKNRWFQDKDGKWYHFNNKGIMETGWFTDTDGKTYYLNISGEMISNGWYEDCNGFWYYLKSSGELLVSGTAPGGYKVNDQGIWIDGIEKAGTTQKRQGG